MLHDTIVGTMGDVEKPAIDASWTIDGTQAGAAGDKPQYVAPAEGMGIDMDSLTQSLTTTAAQGTDPASRTVALPLAVLEPEDTTPEADWGVKEVVGEYSTRYNAEDLPRTQNLRRGAELINGSVVKPGEVFSLEEALGEVDYEHGFADAGVISNGEHIDSLGGGLSQVATTVFNAGFEAGMDDTEHHPHQYYFDRYPAGREATLWTGKLDVKFTNSTTHGVLVQAWLDGEEIHVRLWSTKYYDVTITESERYNFRPVVTERKSGPQCQPYTGGNPGFDITITRVLLGPGARETILVRTPVPHAVGTTASRGHAAMTYVIAQPCVDVKDRACVDECPVDCIYEGERSLYINADECVDCGACEPVCPTEAIFYEDDVPEEWSDYTRANIDFFELKGLGSPAALPPQNQHLQG